MLHGKTVLITGATNGIGKMTAIELAKKGANILFTARHLQRGDRVRAEIAHHAQGGSVTMLECNLASLHSVAQVCDTIMKRTSALHVLINNAGVWETTRRLSHDGIEMMFAVNHLAPYLMTRRLLPIIKNSAPARIITVASRAHERATLDLDDPEMKGMFRHSLAYGQSKLMNIMFTRDLAEELRGTRVTVNCLHPGVIATNLFHTFPKPLVWLGKLFLKNPAEGAKTTIHLATAQALDHITGEYFVDGRIAPISPLAADMQKARLLREVSEVYIRRALSQPIPALDESLTV